MLEKMIEFLSPKKKKEIKDELRQCPFDFAKDNGGLELDAKLAPGAVEFISMHAGLDKWAPVVPQNKAIPDWFKNSPIAVDTIPTRDPNNISEDSYRQIPQGVVQKEFRTQYNHTIKTCAGMHDFFRLGYIMPLWCDVLAETSVAGDFFSLYPSMQPTMGPPPWMIKAAEKSGMSQQEIETIFIKMDGFHSSSHHPNQYKEMIKELPETWTHVLNKIVSPWMIKTPPGWSMYTNEPYFNFNPYVTTIPGILHTDYYHVMNFFWIAKMRGVRWKMELGMPIMKLVPIKREVHDFIVREAGKEDIEWAMKQQSFTSSKMSTSDRYKNFQEFMSNDGSKVIQ
jgi:hypothetical protein